MNERLRALRKYLELNQKVFATKLGITDSGLSNLENGHRNFTEQMILTICREFNVNRAWFVDGIGEMFLDIPDTILDELALQFYLSKEEKELIATFCKLPKEQRTAIMEFLKKIN